jgi:hypothetical protein
MEEFMIDVLVPLALLLCPTLFSLLMYYGLRRIESLKMKKVALLLVFVIFSILVVLWFIYKPYTIGPSSVYSALVSVTIIAFSAAYPVVLAMNIFPGIFSEAGEKFAAALAPLISIPFIIKMLISPDVWNGKTYGADYFFIKIPLIGWIIDPFTSGWVHTTDVFNPLPAVILYFGFFIEMTIVMLLIFWYCKITIGSPGDRTLEQDE